ncbi:MAG: formylglycine-generating enzyme family protein [Prevotella sp.]|nr:formylglycine-generating enzyme family protein [Prevotella sp.]
MRRLVLWMMSPDQIDRPQTEEEIHAFLGQGNEKHIAGGGVVYDDTDDSDEEDIDVEVITAGIASVEAKPAILPVSVKGVSFNMVKVQGGTFMMGATPEQGDDVMNFEKPAHQVTLSDYYIGETEVTQDLWEAVMGENPSWFKGVKHPVERVSWDDCQEFIKKLNQLTGRNFRLPTEAEWEFAARGGTKSRHYKYSGSNNVDDVAWYLENSGDKRLSGELAWDMMEENNCKSHPVGQKSPNELGLYDMSGNVDEWCEDWYDNGCYEKSSSDNPCNAIKASLRVSRGGGWDCIAGRCRVSYRKYWGPDGLSHHLGLRLAL